MLRQFPLRLSRERQRTFTNFIVGSNPKALRAVETLCKSRSGDSLYLWGKSCGKTHLLLAALDAVERHGGEAVYLPMRDEVDPTAIVERAWSAQKRVFAPVTDTHGVMNFCEITPDTVVTRSRYGLWEPASGVIIDARDLDVVITPVVAFDEDKRRIGMGGGYYDRCFHFLKNPRLQFYPLLI